MRIVRDGSDGAIYVLSWDLSTANSQPGEDGSKPCSISHRAATSPLNDHHARITSRSTSVPYPATTSPRCSSCPSVRMARSNSASPSARVGPVDHAGDLVTVDEHVGDLQVAVREHRFPGPERSLGDAAVARDHVGGKDAVRNEPFTFAVEARGDFVQALTGPWRKRGVVQHPNGGTCRGPRRRRRGRRLAEASECPPREGGEREHRRLPPQHLRSRHRCQSHRLNLDLGTRLISVDLEEHVADTQGRPLVMGGDDLDFYLFHVGHYCGVSTEVAWSARPCRS